MPTLIADMALRLRCRTEKQAESTVFDIEATGGAFLLGEVKKQDLAALMTTSTDSSIFFRVFANTPIFFDIEVELFIGVDAPGLGSLDFESVSGYRFSFLQSPSTCMSNSRASM